MIPVASLGHRPYEWICYLARRADYELVIVCDDLLPVMQSDKRYRAFLETYGSIVSFEKTLFLSPFSPGRRRPVRERRLRRDECVLGLSDLVLVAEIRAGGNMDRLAGQFLERGFPLKVYRPDMFSRSTEGNRKLLASGAPSWSENRQIQVKASDHRLAPYPVLSGTNRSLDHYPDQGRYLAHFTRSCPGPWPGQDLHDYYRALADADRDAGHSALDTLRRILDERKIRGGSLLTRGRTPVVSFTSCDLKRLNDLIRWRRTLARWTLEPYGLMIPRASLRALGAAPVIYGDDQIWDRLPDRQRFRFQFRGQAEDDWTVEKEWRLTGDLDLDRIFWPDIIIVVPRSYEADALSGYGLRIIVLQEGLGVSP